MKSRLTHTIWIKLFTNVSMWLDSPSSINSAQFFYSKRCYYVQYPPGNKVIQTNNFHFIHQVRNFDNIVAS